MKFEETGLPDKPLLRNAFNAGWTAYRSIYGDKAETAYKAGPMTMAALLSKHGGDLNQVPVAASLAGPAVFTEMPTAQVDERLVKFANEIRNAKAGYGAIPEFSSQAKLFCQVGAIMVIDQIADNKVVLDDSRKALKEAIDIYAFARGDNDTFELDKKFRTATMKVNHVFKDNPVITFDALPKSFFTAA